MLITPADMILLVKNIDNFFYNFAALLMNGILDFSYHVRRKKYIAVIFTFSALFPRDKRPLVSNHDTAYKILTEIELFI